MKSGLRRSSRYLVLSGDAGALDGLSPGRRSDTGSPIRRSASPGYDRETDRVYSRKRTNTASSGSGDRRTANKICRVCGDKAFSYNFNVITCESCKAFFRRNANKEKDIRCPFSEQCEINVVSRRFCQRCRLTKCFEVGMKKEWIMSEEARLEKKQRVEENRERRMLDALRAEGDTETSPQRGRYKSESKTYDDQSSPSQDYKDYPAQMEEMMPPFSVDPGIPPVSTTAIAMMPLAIGSHNILDPIPTTGTEFNLYSSLPPASAANSLADVSSTTTAVQSMDVDPSSTMSGMGFIPPTIENSVPLLNVSVTNAVENAVMAAQAQLAVQQQVQAAINHQQQIVAAVVANQVAQMAAGPTAPSLPPPMPPVQQMSSTMPAAPLAPPMQAPLPTPSLQPNILAPSMAPAPAPLLLNNSMHHDMVTIPREILLHLIENNTKRTASCSCKCACGRYPPGANIVDEVTKDLLAAGQNANCNSCDQPKDEARLETAEDFQRNGLLPSEDSCVNWLNTQPTVVDPTAFSENSSLPPVDYQPNQMDGVQMVQMSDTDPEIHSLTNLDRDILLEVENANREWGNGFEGNYNYPCYEPMGQSRIEITVKELMNACHKVACLRNIQPIDRVALIRERCLPFQIMRGASFYDQRTNQWQGGHWPQSLEVQRECFMLYAHLPEDVRQNDHIIAVLALLCLFDTDCNVFSREDVAREHGKLVGLLKRLLYQHYGENEVRVRDESAQLLKLLPLVRDLAARCGPAFQYDPQRIEALLLDA